MEVDPSIYFGQFGNNDDDDDGGGNGPFNDELIHNQAN